MDVQLNFDEVCHRIEVFLEDLLPFIVKEEIILNNIKQQLQEPWKESHGALLQKQTHMQESINTYYKYQEEFKFLKEILLDECLKENGKKEIKNLHKNLEEFFLESKFSTKDRDDCLMEIQSGAGGADAEDLAELLMKMYMKWAEKHKRKFIVIDIWPTENGIRSALIRVEGTNSYGFLKGESGIHRFVRHSPFNAANKRQTSFIAVYVYPIEEVTELKIDEKDLEYSFYRSSGAGGQHVNKTESAVRVKHLPTGTIVNCQNERSQLMNKNMAIKFLKIKLLKAEKIAQQEKNVAVEKKNIGWGNQIRSYVMNPYKMVKDLRSAYETSHIDEFLNGNLLQDCLYKNIYLYNNYKKE